MVAAIHLINRSINNGGLLMIPTAPLFGKKGTLPPLFKMHCLCSNAGTLLLKY
jgi:hypothetical protein